MGTPSAAATLTISGSIGQTGGSASLSLDGPGTLVLSGSNSYQGGTLVNSGTMFVSSNEAIPDNTSLSVAAGATLIFSSTPLQSPIVPSSIVPSSQSSSAGLFTAASSQSASAALSQPWAATAVEVVPEPSTLALLAAGAVLLAIYRRRRR